MRARFIIDALAAAVYLVAANPAITGLAVHEWISLGVILVFLIHCTMHYDWVVATVKKHVDKASVAHLVLDSATLIVFVVCVVSGLLVSRYLLPLLGFVAPGYFFWSPVHSLSAKMLLALLLVHLVVHGKWFAALFKKNTGKADEHVTTE
jgi:hypothetical protein